MRPTDHVTAHGAHGPTAEAPAPLDALAAADVRAVLAAAGFGDDALGRAERIVPQQFDAVRRPLVVESLRSSGHPGDLLAAALVYDAPLDRAEARRAIGPTVLDVLVRAGVLEVDGAELVAPWRVTPFEGTLVLSDRPSDGADAVMPPGATTRQLLRAASGWPQGRVADVAAGPGSVALALARAGHVAGVAVATDLSARAVAFARANSALNDLPLDVRVGEGTAPLAGERFDLVVCQPPFVPRPEGADAVTYLHGGARGDELSLALLPLLGAALAPGGVAVARFDLLDGGSGRAPVSATAPATATGLPGRGDEVLGLLEAALGPTRVDMAVVLTPGAPVDLVAAGYASVADPTLGPAYREAAAALRRHLAGLGAERMRNALVVLRRPRGAGRGWRAVVPADRLPVQAGIAARIAAALDLAAGPDDALLAARLVLPAGSSLVEVRTLDGDTAGVPGCVLDAGPSGLVQRSEISDGGAVVIAEVAQGRTVAEAATALAEAAGLEPDDARPLVLAFVREALTSATLLPA